MPDHVSEQASGVLLVLSASEDAALRIERHLRNAGHPLRTAWISNLDELDDALRHGNPELLLCEAGLADIAIEEVIERCRTLRPAMPLLQLGTDLSATTVASALTAGIQDCVSLEDTAHLRHLEGVVLREVINYDHQRSLQHTRVRLSEFESRQRYLTEGTADAVARVQEGILVEANAAFAKLLGQADTSSLAGMPLFDLIPAEQHSRIKQCLRAVLSDRHDGKPVSMTLDAGKGAAKVNVRLMKSNVNGEAGIEMLVSREGATVTSSQASPYTNHAQFLQALAEATDDNSLRAALMIKLDAYPTLEEHVGIIDAQAMCHLVGEDIHTHLETGDTLTRLSNDELALVIARADLSAIESFAEALRAGIMRQAFTTAQHETAISVSVAVYPLGQGEAADNVLRALVTQVRELSAAGGDRLSIVGTTARDKMAQRDAERIVERVRDALKEDRMRLAYQAISAFDANTSNRFDVLLRMIDETGTTLPAGEFLAQAQQGGLMPVIDRWVVSHAAEVAAKHEGHQTLFVKLSEDSTAEADSFLKWLQRLLQPSTFKHESLVFQLHEATVHRHIRSSSRLCKALHEMGFAICIERFGRDPASLNLLEHIPAAYVKLHPDYMNQFHERGMQSRLKELLTACQRRKVQTIVSYVEDARTIAAVWQMGANFVQGFGVQEPDVLLTSQA
ncbi:MAG: EAL domain-containing protein [Sinobacteraceae bacterium]|nr:EAL domain-containing protein [Nevskiaceae bacterium]